jgi:hypothetical protein
VQEEAEMQDGPSAAELVVAVREHIEREILPGLTNPKLRFQTLVAAHVLSVVEREMTAGAGPLQAELSSLRALDGEPPLAEGQGMTTEELKDEVRRRTRALCAAIRSGAVSGSANVVEHVRGTVLAKLAVSNPRYESLPRT